MTVYKKIKIIANPIAGSGKALRFLEHLKAALVERAVESEVILTAQFGDAKETATKHSDNTPILCLGGDGTFNEIINGLMTNPYFAGRRQNTETLPVIGLIPFGSGNVIAKELGLRRNINHFLHLFQNNLSRIIDMGYVRLLNEPSVKERYFISMAGIGFDAEVAHRYQMGRSGAKLQAHLLSYFPIALRTIPGYQMPSISITIDGEPVVNNASFVQVANVRSYGGPFVLVNNALFDDGNLDVCWFNGKSSLSVLLYYTLAFLGNGSLVSGGKQRSKKVVLSSLRDNSLIEAPLGTSESDKQVPIQVDGDFCGYLPAEIEIIPKAVRIFTPL